jgi:hypothetical protein
MYLVRENLHATIKCGGLSSQHPVCFFLFFSTHHLLNFPVLVRPLMGAISAKTVLRTPRRGTSTCYAVMGIVQERAGRSSGLRRSLSKDNPHMNLSSHGKWRLTVNVDVSCSANHRCMFPFSHSRYLSSLSFISQNRTVKRFDISGNV